MTMESLQEQVSAAGGPKAWLVARGVQCAVQELGAGANGAQVVNMTGTTGVVMGGAPLGGVWRRVLARGATAQGVQDYGYSYMVSADAVFDPAEWARLEQQAWGEVVRWWRAAQPDA